MALLTNLEELNACYIDGRFMPPVNAAGAIDVWNPATGELVGRVPHGGAAEARAAVAAAQAAFPAWARTLPADRAVILKRWAQLMLEHAEELARILVAEQGKPFAQAYEEAEGSALFTEWYAEEGKRAYGETVPPSAADKRILVIRQPVGVAALITPWNYPATMVARKAAPALAAGCAIVVKPSSQTPLTAVALARLAHEAGFPPGVVNLVTGSASDIGGEFMANPSVKKVSFTGSTEVGKQLIRASADQVKRLSLELGGNAPFIVFPDADLDLAVDAAVGNKFENCGQMCNGINVIYAHKEIMAAFTDRLTDRVSQLKVGSGRDPDVELGPVIDMRSLDNVHALVTDAVERGARVLTGGHRLTGGAYGAGSFYAPTVLADVEQDMKLANEEIFGPVAPLIPFSDEDEVLSRVNATPYGLAAYVFTRDVRRVFEVSERLEVGMVAVNSASLSVPQAPFGGVKQSGSGREGGHFGLEEFMNIKYISITL
ncbi:MAG: NAD-dependent succinate-semialdehyde dehydrogenase [Bacilli bacterium]